MNCNRSRGQDPAETGPVAGEDDLVAVSLGVSGCPSCDPGSADVRWHVCELGGNRQYTLYRGPDWSGPINHGVEHSWPVSPLVYFEGIKGSACPAPLYFWFNYGGCCWDTDGTVPVVGVTSLTWEQADPGNLALDDCPNNGGKRIFPGKQTPSDSDPMMRRKVDLVATVTPPIDGLEVYFKVWDVDDPFDQLLVCPDGPGVSPDRPCLPNVGTLDPQNPTAGPDNRDTEPLALPWAVILVVPMCLLSALAGLFLAGMDVNIFVQVGFVVLVGLAAKNAILIVEFARDQQVQGASRFDASVEAARVRLRPILMTSFAFILGVFPLVIAHGAGAKMWQTLGMAVFAGMIGVTAFGIFLTPVFYYVIRGLVQRPHRSSDQVQLEVPAQAHGASA